MVVEQYVRVLSLRLAAPGRLVSSDPTIVGLAKGRLLGLGSSLWPLIWACHQTDNRPCVNPEHVYEDNPKSNANDPLSLCRASAC